MTRDLLELRDGTTLEGKITSYEEGKQVVVQLADGSSQTVSWSQLRRVERRSPAPARPSVLELPPRPGPSAPATLSATPSAPHDRPATGRQAGSVKVDTSGVDVTRDCADGDRACQEQLTLRNQQGKAELQYKSEKDCSEGDEECKQRVQASLGNGGLGVSYSRETVKAVREPRSSSTDFLLSLGGVYGTGDNIEIKGGNVALGFRTIAGGTFPREQGGGWAGFYLEPNAAFTIANSTVKFGSQELSSSYRTLNLQSGLGFQFMYFGALGKDSQKQNGFGLALGGTVGTSIPLEGGGDPSATYGPQISLLFPSYNPGTADFSSTNITVLILPLDIFLVTVGAQFLF